MGLSRRETKHSLHLHTLFVLKSDIYLIFAKTEEDNRNLVLPILHIELVSPTVGSKLLWYLVTECGECGRVDSCHDFYTCNSNNSFKVKELNPRNSWQHSREHGAPYADLVLSTWCVPLPEHQWMLPATHQLKSDTTIYMTFSISTLHTKLSTLAVFNSSYPCG